MNRRIAIGTLLGLSPLAATAQHPPDSPEGPPVRVIAVTAQPGHLAGGPQAPFGYFRTHWRQFPTAEIVVSKPAPSLPKPEEKPAEKAPEKKIEPPPPPKLKPASATAGRFATQPEGSNPFVPVPHPAAAAAKTAAKSDRGFAALRTVEMEKAETPPTKSEIIAAPTIRPRPAGDVIPPRADTGIRTVRAEDEVARPDWPKLPPSKK